MSFKKLALGVLGGGGAASAAMGPSIGMYAQSNKQIETEYKHARRVHMTHYSYSTADVLKRERMLKALKSELENYEVPRAEGQNAEEVGFEESVPVQSVVQE